MPCDDRPPNKEAEVLLAGAKGHGDVVTTISSIVSVCDARGAFVVRSVGVGRFGGVRDEGDRPVPQPLPPVQATHHLRPHRGMYGMLDIKLRYIYIYLKKYKIFNSAG